MTLVWRQPGADQHANATVAEWLRKAAGDLDVAYRESSVADRANYDSVCFHSQQGAEKLLKAALEAGGHRPPKVHDLVHLGELLSDRLAGWSFSVDELSELSSAAVEARYPGFSATSADALRALDIATRLWATLRPFV